MYLKYLYQQIYSLHDPVHVERFQKYFGLEIVHQDQNGDCNYLNDKSKKSPIRIKGHKRYRINNLFWYYLFSFGARLGYELFYAFSFSYLFWNLDSVVCRRLMFVWSVLMYIGQALKDVIQIPRPSGPNILVMEPEYSLEYGMPSTHAMLALLVPLTLFQILIKRYESMQLLESPYLFISIATCWCLLICCSRLYLGMHSILDILVGLLLTAILLLPTLPCLDYIDLFLARHWLSPPIIIATLILLSLIYPKSNRHLSPSRGDTITIISATGGVYLGCWLNYQFGITRMVNFESEYLFQLVWPTVDQIPVIALRTILGMASIFLLRTVGKQLSMAGVRLLTGINDFHNEHTKHQTIVEIPIKMVPFLFIGLAISFVGPAVARLLAIERHSIMFEA